MERVMCSRDGVVRLGVVVVLSACTIAAGLAGTASAGAATAQARQILAATGVRGGLVVHVGCGDGTLTAALRASDSYLVHGLDT